MVMLDDEADVMLQPWASSRALTLAEMDLVGE